MLTAALYGIGTALPLVAGAAVGLRWQVPQRVLAALMAFGAGTMIAAASSELFGPAFEEVGVVVAGAALLAGAGLYVTASHLLDTRVGGSAVGVALVLGATLDGVPENTALGVSLDAGGAGGLVLLVAIAVGNTPEAVASGASLRDDPHLGGRRGLALWTGVALVLALVTVGAWAAADVVGATTIAAAQAFAGVLALVTVGAWAAADVVGATTIAAAQAFAGGATIAVLAETLLPEAYREGGWWIGVATALGFLLAFALG